MDRPRMIMRRFLRWTTAVLCLAGLSGTALAAESTPAPTQLPRTVRPTSYDIKLEPNPAALTFRGNIGIAIEVLSAVDSITLNAIDMTFAKVRLIDSKGSPSAADPKITTNETDQTATFAFGRSIPAGQYSLAIDYTGKIGLQATGLLAIDYDAAGKKRALYTQFEASDARRMIPSWDEPAHKATFTLEAIVPRDQMAISNMPVAERTDV